MSIVWNSAFTNIAIDNEITIDNSRIRWVVLKNKWNDGDKSDRMKAKLEEALVDLLEGEYNV